MKTTRRGLFGIFSGAAAVVATKRLKLPEPVVDTTTFETVGYGVPPVYYGGLHGGGKSYFSPNIIATAFKDNISRNNPLFERLNAKGRIHKLKKT